jgi:hypothetical protein
MATPVIIEIVSASFKPAFSPADIFAAGEDFALSMAHAVDAKGPSDSVTHKARVIHSQARVFMALKLARLTAE